MKRLPLYLDDSAATNRRETAEAVSDMNGTHERGQGIIEYMLLAAVVVLALVAFGIAYQSGTNTAGTAVTNAIDQVNTVAR